MDRTKDNLPLFSAQTIPSHFFARSGRNIFLKLLRIVTKFHFLSLEFTTPPAAVASSLPCLEFRTTSRGGQPGTTPGILGGSPSNLTKDEAFPLKTMTKSD